MQARDVLISKDVATVDNSCSALESMIRSFFDYFDYMVYGKSKRTPSSCLWSDFDHDTRASWMSLCAAALDTIDMVEYTDADVFDYAQFTYGLNLDICRANVGIIRSFVLSMREHFLPSAVPSSADAGSQCVLTTDCPLEPVARSLYQFEAFKEVREDYVKIFLSRLSPEHLGWYITRCQFALDTLDLDVDDGWSCVEENLQWCDPPRSHYSWSTYISDRGFVRLYRDVHMRQKASGL